MRPLAQIVVGRAAESDVQLVEATVSTHHARLSWQPNRRILVEDLGSSNGTFLDGERITRAFIKVGDPLVFGDAPLPWSHRAVVAFVRKGAGGTIAMSSGTRPRRLGRKVAAGIGLVGLVGLCGAALFVLLELGAVQRSAREIAQPTTTAPESIVDPYVTASAEEASIRVHRLPEVLAAIDVGAELTRNTAVQIASRASGPFSVDQVANLWSEVRLRWSYVNDPRGAEYFARASESIANGYAGDCDDFAITLAALITAIGGQTRIVIMESDKGGHAYAEACLEGTPDDVKTALVAHYRSSQARGGRKRVRAINYRTGERCAVWLNLDWSDEVPGGPYEQERWAVAIYPDGTTETLLPAGAPVAATAAAASAR
ncbi:MAG: FHA domain-containing protein [Polyangiaceae bacterium]|nr:FHA domain-containing protein [Polyangiaceae bacterium]